MTIKEARIKTKRSPEEVAKLLGFPLKTWLAWEEEEKKPPKSTISHLRLRSVFKMRISILNTATTEQIGYGSFSFFCLI